MDLRRIFRGLLGFVGVPRVIHRLRRSMSAWNPEVVVDRRVTVVKTAGETPSLDQAVLDSGLREALLDIADDASPPLVVLDLSRVTFFGSSFIETLFRMWNRLQAKPGGGFAI